ncbi:fibronectin type III domain-containing protein [candidate division WOR-3 bacterium]|nr:fibronectin type III domain-containing protein [candidate division WOR-3 bacterium]
MIHLLLISFALTPPESVLVRDNPNDQGQAIVITWTHPAPESILGFRIFRSTSPTENFTPVDAELLTSTDFLDTDTLLRDGIAYYYLVRAYSATDSADSDIAGPVTSRAQWFNTGRLNVLILTLIISTLFLYYIIRARRGIRMFIRKISGLDAIDDALGRATEMGKPILFSFGLGYITDMVVIAALPLLRRIGKKSAEYAVRLIVPNSDPIVMTAAQETVKEAYTEAGRPDLYNPDNITFLTSDQFGYAAGVDGIILRERPGAIFWLGYFYAESLILAETGHTVGAIQLAGTTETTQLPFFVAACDYTMIGEEIYAASCYLKPEPVMLGTIKGEDFIKMLLIVIISALVFFGTIAALFNKQVPTLQQVFEAIVNWFAPPS